MAVLLSLAAALCYGLSDFVGGLAARRTSPWPIAALSGVGGLLGALVLAAVHPGHPTFADLAWGALAGAGSGFGTGFLYRGFAAGRMGVVAPVSAVGAALLPAVVGLATGDRLGPPVWVGVAVAFPGIWLVSLEPAEAAASAGAGGLLDGVLAGAGFGLLFAAMGQVPDGAGYAPLAVAQAVSTLVVVAIARGLGGSARPRALSDLRGVGAGLLASLAVLCFLVATQTGQLTVAAVVTSLYPAITVLLAAGVLHERVHGLQAVGLLLSALTVALVAAG